MLSEVGSAATSGTVFAEYKKGCLRFYYVSPIKNIENMVVWLNLFLEAGSKYINNIGQN